MMRSTVLMAACALALAAALTAVPALAPQPVTAEASAAEASASARAADQSASASTARRAPRRFRTGYRRWRKRLQRHDLYVGRDLLPRVRAAGGTWRPPTKGELRRSIHRMQRRWARYTRTTRRGRNAMFRLKVRRAVPRWGKQHLRSIAWCESRNRPRAIGGGGSFRGMYQFTFRTWYVVGGEGDPAAAPRYEQTWRAWLLLSRHGSGHWPVCG